MKYAIAFFSLVIIAGAIWAFGIAGFRLDDPELEDHRSWVQGFRMDQPEVARLVGQECKAAQARSPWTRDGAMELFTCIRGKAEAQGYHYE